MEERAECQGLRAPFISSSSLDSVGCTDVNVRSKYTEARWGPSQVKEGPRKGRVSERHVCWCWVQSAQASRPVENVPNRSEQPDLHSQVSCRPVSAPHQPHSEERASHPGPGSRPPLPGLSTPTWFSITQCVGQQLAYLIETLLTLDGRKQQAPAAPRSGEGATREESQVTGPETASSARASQPRGGPRRE